VIRLVVKRVLYTIPILLGVSVICFLLMSVLPGNPAAALLNDQMSEAEKQQVLDETGYGDPLPMRYLTWLGGVLTGDMGYSDMRQRPVTQLLVDSMGNTMVLALVSAALGVLGGLALGYLAGTRRGSLVDRVVSVISLAGLSVPSFFLAIVLLAWLAGELRLLPAGGAVLDQGPGPLLATLALPVLTGGMVTTAITARVTRASIVDTMSADFVETLRAKGLTEWEVRRHVLRNALPPVLTTSGVQLGVLLGGAVIVETIFRWPGMGTLVFQAISARDLVVIQGATLLIAVAFVLINLVVDIVQAAMDPRVRGAMT